MSLHELLIRHYSRFRIEVSNVTVLRNMHVGIILKKEVYKLLKLTEEIRSLKMYVDNSVYGCKEIEAAGKYDQATTKAQAMLNILFEKTNSNI